MGAIAGGLDVFYGYPISPATTILVFMENNLNQEGQFVGQTSSEIKAGQARIELYKDDGRTFVGGTIVDQGKPTTIGDLTVTFVREQQFTGLIAAKDPGVPIVWGGALLLLLGVAVVFYFHNRRIWAIVHRAPGGSTVSIAAVVRHDVTYRQEFGHLMEGIQRTLAPTTE